MVDEVVILYDRDYCFMDRLAQYIMARIRSLEVHIATNEESLIRLFSEYSVQSIVCSRTVKLPKEVEGARIILFTEVKEEIGLFKYQNASVFVNKLQEKMTYVPSNQEKLIGVFSPCGGSGKTTFSLVYAQVFSQWKKVLYVGFEGYSSLNLVKGGLSILYLSYLHGRECQEAVREVVTHIGGLDCLTSPVHFRDLFDIQIESIRGFFSWLREKSGYDLIVVDIGCLMEYTLDLLEEMDCIYVPSYVKDENQLIDEVKKRVFLQYLSMEGRDKLKKHIHVVKLPYLMGVCHESEFIVQAAKGEMGRYIEDNLSKAGKGAEGDGYS